MNNLIFCGYKSSGKTYFGKKLAKELERAFIDTDFMLEKLYQEEYCETLSCRSIYLKLGEKAFRLLEERVIDSLRPSDAVIALGGGAILNPKNCLKLQKLGRLIYLEADKEIIKSRMFSKGTPSFLDSKDPEHSFKKMIEERKSVYRQISSFTLNVQGKTDRHILDELKILIANHY